MRKIVFIAMILILPSLAGGQTSDPGARPENEPVYRSIPAIKLNPVEGRLAKIVGTITNQFQIDDGSENYYLLRDDTGSYIRVRCTGEPPAEGDQLLISGRVTFVHSPRLEVIMVEESREQPPPEEPDYATDTGQPNPDVGSEATEPSEDAPEDAEGGIDLLVWTAGIIVLLALAAGAFLLLKRMKFATPAGVEEAPALPGGELPDSLEEVQGDIIRTYYPTADVVTFPGHLEVVSGEDKLDDLRLQLSKGFVVAEFTFDRREIRDAGHFFIDHESISESQAKIVFADDTFSLINYATENRTRSRKKNPLI